MTDKKNEGEARARLVRKSVFVDADQLEQARKLLHAKSDADTLRLALAHLVSHIGAHHEEEE